MRSFWMAAALLAPLAAGCGGGDAGLSIDRSVCRPDAIVFVGDLEGTAIPQDPHATSGGVFQQIQKPYSYDLTYDGGTLHLEWNAPLFEGRPGGATGSVVMPPGAPHAGETVCGGKGLFGYFDDNPGTTRLLDLEELSLGCGGAAIAGALSVCVTSDY
jgi:hypothetical protein